MAWATFNASQLRALAAPWSAWQLLVRQGRQARHAAAAEQQRQLVSSARAQAEEVAPCRVEFQAQP